MNNLHELKLNFSVWIIFVFFKIAVFYLCKFFNERLWAKLVFIKAALVIIFVELVFIPQHYLLSKQNWFSSQQNSSHLLIFLRVLIAQDCRLVGVAVRRAEVLHEWNPVSSAEVDELDVLHPRLEVDAATLRVDAVLRRVKETGKSARQVRIRVRNPVDLDGPGRKFEKRWHLQNKIFFFMI